jgi:hypothetical protein
MKSGTFLRFWPLTRHHEKPISAESVDFDQIEIPPDEAGWEDYMRYRAAQHRCRNLKDNK